jgi:hypothetical protein
LFSGLSDSKYLDLEAREIGRHVADREPADQISWKDDADYLQEHPPVSESEPFQDPSEPIEHLFDADSSRYQDHQGLLKEHQQLMDMWRHSDVHLQNSWAGQ